MNKNTGYKQMLRDRISKMQAVNLALKFNGAKDRWINHVYDNFIAIFAYDNNFKWHKERDAATKAILGINGKYNQFDFHKTIAWDNLDQDEKEYWEIIEGWVTWFSKNIAYIENEMHLGYDNAEILSKHKDLLTRNDGLNIISYIRENI